MSNPSDMLDVIEAAKKSIEDMGDAFADTAKRMRVLREENLKRQGPKAELLWRLNQIWQYNRDPGDPVNWRGRGGLRP